MNDRILVLSHLFPNAARPGNGPFVADEVAVLTDHFPLTVISPMRWLPPAPYPPWRRERRVPRREAWRSVPVFRPRVLALPHGGLELEARLWPPQLWPLVRRVAARDQISLVHGHFALPDGFAAVSLARRLAVPAVVTLYGDDVLAYSRAPRLRRLLERAVRGADHLVAVSHELRDRALALGATPDKTTVIPSSVPDGFHPIPTRAARAKLGLSPEEQWVVWIGNRAAKKQPEVALEAFALAARRCPAARLAMLGEAGSDPALAARARSLGIDSRVRFVGHVRREEVALWQNAANVALSSSRSEGTPNVLVEALVCGTPVAAFSVGGIPHLVELTNGGTLANGSSAGALAEALVAELARERPRGSVASAAERLTRRQTVKTLVDVYARLLDV